MTWWRKRAAPPLTVPTRDDYLRDVGIYEELREASVADALDLAGQGLTDQEIVDNLTATFFYGSKHPGFVMSRAFAHTILWLARNPDKAPGLSSEGSPGPSGPSGSL